MIYNLILISCLLFAIKLVFFIYRLFKKTNLTTPESIDLSDTIENDSIYEKIEQIPAIENSVVHKKSKQEIIDDLIFTISSDLSCGRQDQAVQAMQVCFSEGFQIKELFIDRYISNQYHVNPEMFEITFFILQYLDKMKKEFMINELITRYTLHLEAHQIEVLLNQVNITSIARKSETLLLCFIANQFDKVQLFLNFNFDPGDLVCTNVHYIFSKKGSDGTYFYNSKEYIIKAEYLGLKLCDALELNGFNTAGKNAM